MGGENRLERHRGGGHAGTCQHCRKHESSSPAVAVAEGGRHSPAELGRSDLSSGT